jgi:transcriptional regulator with XRE-family HTH domain
MDMSSIGERIKMIRQAQADKSLRSQESYGARIGITKSSISQIESGKNTPSEMTLIAICREFNINESWLRTGEGEMQNAPNRDEQVAAFVGRVLSGRPEDDFKRRLIGALSRLDSDGWDALERVARSIFEEENKPGRE